MSVVVITPYQLGRDPPKSPGDVDSWMDDSGAIPGEETRLEVKRKNKEG